MSKTIADNVKHIIADMLGKQTDEIDPAATFESLGADSLDTVEICIELEDEFGIEIPDEEWEKVKTVQQAVDLVERMRALRAS
jgi:acyl carrier protein